MARFSSNDKAAAKQSGKIAISAMLSGDLAGSASQLYATLKPISLAHKKEQWLIIAAAALFGLLLQVTGSAALSILILATIVGILLTQPKPRRFLLSLLAFRKSPIREYKDLLAGIFDPAPAPQVLDVQDDGTAVKLQVRLLPGHSYTDLEKALETFLIAGDFGSGHLTRDPKNASLCEFSFVRGAPLTEKIIPWNSSLEQVDVWNPLTLGITELGSPLELSLFGRNVFVAGEPNSGKTFFTRALASYFGLDPTADLYIADFKGVDFTLYPPVCKAYAGPSLTEWEFLLTILRDELNRRLAFLRSHKLKKWDRSCGGLILALFEEVGTPLSMGKEAKNVTDGIRDLLQRARAVGIICVLSTQRPGSDTFPTALRDLVGVRVSFRCSTRDASDIALGAGWASQGFNASTIPLNGSGIGYCLGEGGLPQLFRGIYISDEQEVEIIDAACRMRGIDPNASFEQLDGGFDALEEGDSDA